MHLSDPLHDHLQDGQSKRGPLWIRHVVKRRLAAILGRSRLKMYSGGHAAALALIEGLIAKPAGGKDLSFLDRRSLWHFLTDHEYRAWIRDQILLPSDRLLVRERSAIVPRLFIPALLTYVERPLSILVTGEDAAATKALCDSLKQHAPWHHLIAAPDEGLATTPSVDLVLSCKRQVAREDRLRMAIVRAGLVIYCGEHLVDFSVEVARPTAVPGSDKTGSGEGARAA